MNTQLQRIKLIVPGSDQVHSSPRLTRPRRNTPHRLRSLVATHSATLPSNLDLQNSSAFDPETPNSTNRMSLPVCQILAAKDKRPSFIKEPEDKSTSIEKTSIQPVEEEESMVIDDPKETLPEQTTVVVQNIQQLEIPQPAISERPSTMEKSSPDSMVLKSFSELKEGEVAGVVEDPQVKKKRRISKLVARVRNLNLDELEDEELGDVSHYDYILFNKTWCYSLLWKSSRNQSCSVTSMRRKSCQSVYQPWSFSRNMMKRPWKNALRICTMLS